MLLLLLLLPTIQSLASRFLSADENTNGTDTRKTEPPKTLTKGIKGCPSEGYFFERQQQNISLVAEPGPCYLCYCRSDELAVCTLRDNARCDDENRSYHTDAETTTRRHRRRKHRRRLPRSPGLMELFFKDKKNDHLLKEMAQINDEDCQPRASKSIGCPPKNWCTGCLVCDCDDDGIWRCHVMSFCEEQTPRIPMKMKTDSLKNILAIAKKTKKSLMVKKKKKVIETTTKPVQQKKPEKRSVNPNKDNKIAPSKNNTNVKKDTKTKSGTKKVFKKILHPTSTSTTTIKPVIPPISVKTKISFLRKDKQDKVLVIKKYISTMAPIKSPELLKYKNDSSKLAQILYQHYEASANETKKAKREIKLEDRAGSKAITHNLSKKNKAKYKYYAGNSKTVGDKILNMNPMPKYMKNNVIGRKPVNVKEHSNRNTKMEALKETRNKRFSFYDVQRQLMETGTVSSGKKTPKVKDKDPISKLKKRYKFQLVTLAYRKKRDVSLTMGDASNELGVGNEKENISSVHIDQVSTTPLELSTTEENRIVNFPSVNTYHVTVAPAEVLTNNQEVPSSLNNYVYTVDNMANKNDSSSEIIDSIKAYEPTLKEVNTYATKNTDIEITTTKIPKAINDSMDYYHETFTQVLKSNQESTTSVVYNFDGNTKKNEVDNNMEIVITTTTGNNLEELENKTQLVNGTDNQKIMPDFSNSINLKQAKVIDEELPKDRIGNNDTITTDLNTSKLGKIIKANDFKAIKKIFFVRQLNNTIDRNFSTTYKNRPEYEMVLIKYLKNMYSKLLSNKNNQTRFSKNVVMKSICDTFGPCKISSKSVHVINAKITQLVSETKNALNVIKTMKGSLQLIDSANGTENITEEMKFKSYVSKLNAILTDTYETPRTEHEITQIRDIKNNTKVFINSVGKFAIILNDILKIIRSDKIKYDNLKKRKMALKKVIRPKVDSEILHKIKKMFLKFNLLQNNFMHKMYQVISDLDVQNHESGAVDRSKHAQREKRYRKSVRKYMNKIKYNLAKLKNFALKMQTRERKKRYVRDDDDAVEYLLTLIEYLLKVNNPVDSRPVTDGIDVLLDAIRRAPGIKPIRKMNLEETATDPSYSPVKEFSQSNSESVDEKEENVSNSVNETEILKDDSSLETWINGKEPKPSTFGSNKLEEDKPTTPHNARKMNTQASPTKYVDVEDIVFNGDQPLNVYIATYPPVENTEETFLEERENTKKAKKQKSKNKPAISKLTATRIPQTTNQTKPQENKVTENVTKSHFDLLNEEYENRLKRKPTTKPMKVKLHKKHKKTKRPRVQHREVETRIISKTDVSTITKEIDEERTKKSVVAEQADLRKHMTGSIHDDPFKLTADDDSISKDISLIEAQDDEPKSYFSPVLD